MIIPARLILYMRNCTSHLCHYCFLAMLIFFTGSCRQQDHLVNNDLKKQLKIIDSLIATGKSDTDQLILNARSKIPNSSPAIVTYYCILSGHYNYNQQKMNLYADSALSFFTASSRISEYPNDYFKSLMVKGDACLRAKKYVDALGYFYKGKKELTNSTCDDGQLDTKMGYIYYEQQNFKLAARYWADSYYRLEACHYGITAENLFGLKQGALDNAGVSYERAGFLDSAKYFYLKDLELLNRVERDKRISIKYFNDAMITVYDNLGGLYLKSGHLDTAQNYLNKCIAITTLNTNSIKIPPLVKLAELYLKTNDNKKAALAFEESKDLLNRFSKSNLSDEINWNKLYAEYLFKVKRTDEAYLYQKKYIDLKDSVDNSLAALNRLDVQRELSSINQREEVADLQHKDKIRIIYLVSIGIIGLLSVVIIILIYLSLKQEKKNRKSAEVRNLGLQHAHDELELVNKNYIRIMRVMAHDLRNPLSGIKALTSLLLEEQEFSEESKHMLELIEKTGTHTMEMINILLRSGLADENEPIQKEPVDLRSLLYDAVELLQFRANEKKQQLIFEGGGVPIITAVNRENIWRVFNNLIINAIKFSETNGIIHIGIKTVKDGILMSVADNGIGIPEKDRDSVFDMFTSAKKRGTNGEEAFGLGLSISKKIIENHEGKIWFESNPGEGTVFYVQLPNND